MSVKNTTHPVKNSFSLISLLLTISTIFVGVVIISVLNNRRQYTPAINTEKGDDGDMDAAGMAQYFFNARKNIQTNAMDYASMLAADIADRAMNKTHNSRRLTNSFPPYNWTSMGPSNTGGRTRAILIDNTNPTHQTLFACGVSGGIWKSTNAGGSWSASAPGSSLNDTMQNINACCIAQDANGAIYVGTGEGFSVSGYQTGEAFSSGILGGGIFKSTDDGKTWRILTKTIPSQINNNTVAWAYTNRIAIRPDSFKVIYAATNTGLYISHDSGATWTVTKSSTNQNLISNALDVKISTDGSIVVASIGGSAYYCYPQSGADNIFTEFKSTGYGKLPINGSRIEIAISPTDANRVYVSYINSVFAPGSTSAIYMNKTATNNGGYWYLIGPGGSIAFDPYGEPSTGTQFSDQATYDNTLAVFPNNEGALVCGGTTLWEWIQASSIDTVGSWSKLSDYGSNQPSNPLVIHSDLHALVFDPNNSDILYIGCDGGVFESTNATSAETPRGVMTFQGLNRNYNVTQYYTVSFSSQANYSNNEGVGGGTQDNGSPYVNGESYYQYDATDMGGGDGAGSVVSALAPNIAYFCSDDGALLKTGNLGVLSQPTPAYTQTIGDSIGANIDSVHSYSAAKYLCCFVFQVALYENPYDTLNHDSLSYQAIDTIKKLDTIWPISQNGLTTYPYVVSKAYKKGVKFNVPDRVVSRLAIGFNPTQGVWINGQGASNGNITWMPIAGPHSKPDSYSGSNPIHSLAWSPDGNALFAGDEGGGLFRFLNINSIIANKFISGALWYEKPGTGVVYTAGNQVISNNLTAALNTAGGGGRDILSISTDPQNGNNMLVTEGNYGEAAYVFYTDSALAQTPAHVIFTSVQGNLPGMPVYGCVVDLLNPDGTWNTNAAMLATEHGIYTTANLKATPVVWQKNSKGMANCLTLAIKQQTWPAWKCNTSSNIYVGSHGRGLWASLTAVPTSVPSIATSSSSLTNLLVYPNPITYQGNIEYTLSATDNINIVIYDMQGKEVQTINMQTQAPGIHTVPFEASQLKAGIYFATVTGTNFRKESKFVVIK